MLRLVGRGRKLQRDLTREEAERVMTLMLTDNTVSDAQIGALLVNMRVKEETVEEIIGFITAARAAMTHLPTVKGLVDLGYPYNGKTKRLQTGIAAALVLAASGVPVLVHGADNIPTKAGVASLNLLEAMGYPSRLSPEGVSANLEATNFGVLDLAHVLPQWTALTEMRHHFGVRTLMNTVEKLLNPADADTHICGFYHGSYLVRMAQALPAPVSWIVQGDEGSIDLAIGKKTRVYRATGNEMVETLVNAADYGFGEAVSLDTPPDPQAHAELLLAALNGQRGHVYDQIALTAGALFWMVGRTDSIEDGIEEARAHLGDGSAQAILHQATKLHGELR